MCIFLPSYSFYFVLFLCLKVLHCIPSKREIKCIQYCSSKRPYFKKYSNSFRLRALSDLEAQVQAQQVEFQNIRELQDEQGGGENLFQELDTQWKETQKAFSDRLVGQEKQIQPE